LVARRDILIEAPVDVVWDVVTQPAHIAGWFSEKVELDLRPGGRAAFHWNDHGTVHGRVERVEPPNLFSFRWALRHDEELADGNSTLVEFSLREEGGSTRLTVVESGLDQEHFEGHQEGWERELGELEEYVRR
jgi:uncharacterized protein YndB with AHSA1/START domain